MIKKIMTSLLVLLSVITMIPVSCDTTEGSERYEVTARLLLPEELKDSEGQVSVIYKGEETDIFLELNKENDYTATQYVVNGSYGLFANIAGGGFSDYSFWTKKTFDVANEKVVINVFIMSNSEYLNAELYDESPTGLSECGEEYAKREEQRLAEAKTAAQMPSSESQEVKEPVQKREETGAAVQEPTVEESLEQVEMIDSTVIIVGFVFACIILLLLLYLLLIRPKKNA